MTERIRPKEVKHGLDRTLVAAFCRFSTERELRRNDLLGGLVVLHKVVERPSGTSTLRVYRLCRLSCASRNEGW